MAFSQETIDAAWRRAGGKCENPNCRKALDPQNDKVNMKWHAHHIQSQKSGGSDSLANCKILCVPCHENTRSYGQS